MIIYYLPFTIITIIITIMSAELIQLILTIVIPDTSTLTLSRGGGGGAKNSPRRKEGSAPAGGGGSNPGSTACTVLGESPQLHATGVV